MTLTEREAVAEAIAALKRAHAELNLHAALMDKRPERYGIYPSNVMHSAATSINSALASLRAVAPAPAASDIVGKLWALQGIAQPSADGFTYLNEEARMLIEDAAKAFAAPAPADHKVCEHDWIIWPETDGQEQKCMKCGAYRRTLAETTGDGRRKGNSKLAYNKTTRTIDTVRSAPSEKAHNLDDEFKDETFEIDIVKQAIFDALCPGIRATEEDDERYGDAAQAVIIAINNRRAKAQQDAVFIEREACAQIADSYRRAGRQMVAANHIAYAIRSRTAAQADQSDAGRDGVIKAAVNGIQDASDDIWAFVSKYDPREGTNQLIKLAHDNAQAIDRALATVRALASAPSETVGRGELANKSNREIAHIVASACERYRDPFGEQSINRIAEIIGSIPALPAADREAIREALKRNRDTLKAVIDGTTWGHEATTKLMQRVIEARDECTAALALIGEG